MLSRLAAQCWVESLLSSTQVLGRIAQHDVIGGFAQAALVDGGVHQPCQPHSCSYHTSSSSPAEQPPKQFTEQPAETASPTSTVIYSDADKADTQQQTAIVAQQAAAASAPAGFATLPGRSTSTGYEETLLVNAAEQSAAEQPHQALVQALPEERLRIQLRQEAKKEVENVEIDAYSLSRSLVGRDAGPSRSSSPAATPQQQQQQELTAADKEVFEKLVGILTKDGKKSRARRIVLDAMHIIKQQLAQGKTTA